MSDRQRRFADAVYPQLARIGKALSSPIRLEILDLLRQGPRSVEAIAEQAGVSLANASQHLQQLRAARLVESDKKGQHVIYRVADQEVCRFYCSLRGLAEARLAEVDVALREFFPEESEAEREELLQRMRAGELTVLDVRPEEEYRAGHLERALSIPLAQLRRRLDEIPRDRDVVVYCRGPYCVMAAEAVEVLRRAGFTARRLDLGVLELRARRWRIESSEPRPRQKKSAPKRPSRGAGATTSRTRTSKSNRSRS